MNIVWQERERREREREREGGESNRFLRCQSIHDLVTLKVLGVCFGLNNEGSSLLFHIINSIN
jgi:hypothetical protein